MPLMCLFWRQSYGYQTINNKWIKNVINTLGVWLIMQNTRPFNALFVIKSSWNIRSCIRLSHKNKRPTAIHMLDCFVSIIRRLKIDISISTRELRMIAIRRHFDGLDSTIDGEYLHDVFAVHIACEMADVDLGWLRCRTALTSSWCLFSARWSRTRTWPK